MPTLRDLLNPPSTSNVVPAGSTVLDQGARQAHRRALRSEAERAVKEGRTVFTPMLNTPASQSALSGSVAGWAEMIESVESAGWTLTAWSVSTDHKGRPQAYPLFRLR